MSSPATSEDQAFVAEVEHTLGRRLDATEARLAASLKAEKSAAVVAREMDAAPIADPKKIRPEHSDVATNDNGDASPRQDGVR